MKPDTQIDFSPLLTPLHLYSKPAEWCYNPERPQKMLFDIVKRTFGCYVGADTWVFDIWIVVWGPCSLAACVDGE